MKVTTQQLVSLAGKQWHRSLLMSLFLTFGLTACGGGSDTTDQQQPPPPAATTDFVINADSAQNIPDFGSAATGVGSLQLNEQTGNLTGSLTVTGMTPSVAHIHGGVAGINGAVVVALEVDANAVKVPEATTLSNDQMAAMLRGEFYINLHSAVYPGGEIRAQVAPDNVSVTINPLPPESAAAGTSNASGVAYVTLNKTSGDIVIKVRTTGLESLIGAHLHDGAVGSDGPILVVLSRDPNDPDVITSAQPAVINALVMPRLLAGDTYVNIHTRAYVAGELRGQIAIR